MTLIVIGGFKRSNAEGLLFLLIPTHLIVRVGSIDSAPLLWCQL